MSTFPVDINTALLLECQEVINGSSLADLSGNENAGVGATGTPLAFQPGPISGIQSRYADGIGGKYFTAIAVSSAWQAAWQNNSTLEIIFSSAQLADAQDSRTLYALSSGSSKFGWIFWTKSTGKLTFDWTHQGVEQSIDLTIALADNVWYYYALRKTVTSGSTVSNRINTLDFWLLPLTGTWNDTPTATVTGQLNPDDSTPPNNSVGVYWQGNAAFPGSYHVAGLKGSSIARTTAELKANFNAYAGIIPAPVVPPVTPGVAKMAYYTNLVGLGATNILTTFTHSLSITAALLVARPTIHQAVVTNTAPMIVGSIGTNLITVASGVGTLVTFDLEVQQIMSLIS